jgi:hypothetical protein
VKQIARELEVNAIVTLVRELAGAHTLRRASRLPA